MADSITSSNTSNILFKSNHFKLHCHCWGTGYSVLNLMNADCSFLSTLLMTEYSMDSIDRRAIFLFCRMPCDFFFQYCWTSSRCRAVLFPVIVGMNEIYCLLTRTPKILSKRDTYNECRCRAPMGSRSLSLHAFWLFSSIVEHLVDAERRCFQLMLEWNILSFDMDTKNIV